MLHGWYNTWSNPRTCFPNPAENSIYCATSVPHRAQCGPCILYIALQEGSWAVNISSEILMFETADGSKEEHNRQGLHFTINYVHSYFLVLADWFIHFPALTFTLQDLFYVAESGLLRDVLVTENLWSEISSFFSHSAISWELLTIVLLLCFGTS